MAQPTEPPSALVGLARRVYAPIGFTKGYNFLLFFIFGGALMGFTLARFMYIDVDNVFCGAGFSASNRASPGECYYYGSGLYRAGMLLHLACVLPAAFLVVFQFVPAIRHKCILIHRINGYIVLLLSVPATVGALIVTRRAFGGGLDIQSAFGVLSFMFLAALLVAYINIKRLRIDQHRAWMLRAWFYAGAIVTTRPIMIIAAKIISSQGTYYEAIPCSVVQFVNSTRPLGDAFPTCSSPDAWAVVRADIDGDSSPLGAAAALHASFGMAGWVAIALHAVGVEVYLRLTPAESERLRNVSLQRRLEAGMTLPASSSLVDQQRNVKGVRNLDTTP